MAGTSLFGYLQYQYFDECLSISMPRNGVNVIRDVYERSMVLISHKLRRSISHVMIIR